MQVIFPALDIRVKNVAQTYSLEHKGESNLFDHLFELLSSNSRNDESFLRELASCTGALQTTVSQHMSKEEEQVLLCPDLLSVQITVVSIEQILLATTTKGILEKLRKKKNLQVCCLD